MRISHHHAITLIILNRQELSCLILENLPMMRLVLSMLEAMSVSFTYGFVTNMLGVLKFLKDYIPCFRKYAHDCLIEKGAFEAPIPLSDIYYEE